MESTTTMEVSEEGNGIDNVYEGSDIRGRRWGLLRRNDMPEELATTTEASAEEDESEVLTTTAQMSAGESKETARLSECLRRRRRRCVYWLRVLMTMTSAS